MARVLTAGTIAQSIRRLGSEPIVIVKIDWVSGTKYYSDKSFILGTLNIEGRIIDFGTISSKINEYTYGGVDSANITLCDIDSTLKTIFDLEAVEKRPVTVYHHFEGLVEADLTPILMGKVMSPITWSEGERTLSFDINNDWDSEDLLLELKETSVDFPSEEEIGTVFPLCFGTVIRVPGVRVSRGKTGKLLTPIFSWTTWYETPDDPTSYKFTYKKTRFDISGFEGSTGESMVLEIGGCLFGGTFVSDKTFECTSLQQFNGPWLFGINIINRNENDSEYTSASCAWVSGLGAYDLKGKYVHIRYMAKYSWIEYIRDDGSLAQDEINGDQYAVLKDSEDDSVVDVARKTVTESFVAQITGQDNINNKIYFSQPCKDAFGNDVLLGGGIDTEVGEHAVIAEAVGQLEYDWVMLPTDGAPLRWDIGPGAAVKRHDAPPDLYVFNSVASEDMYYDTLLSPGIFEVTCKMDGVLYLLPSDCYVINLANILNVNGVMETLTTIYLKRDITQDGWDDSNIYASLHSSIHSNTATDVINWIALNRTSLTPNTINFIATGILVENYPSHFALFTQRDAIDGIQEISWLARLGVFIDAGEIFLKYISKEPTTHVFEALTNNIRFKSMNISKTSSDDIFTKFTSLWNFTYEESEKNKIKSENNVDIYTEEKFEINNIIYNIRSLVQKSHDFWLNRKSNCWYTLSIDTFLTSLVVQPWDAVLINVSFINGGVPILGEVRGIGHDSVTHQIVLDVWLPLKHGEGDAYLDDSGDTKPDDPGMGLDALDYAVIKGRPVWRVLPSIMKHGRSRKKNSALSDQKRVEERILNTLQFSLFHAMVTSIGPNTLFCRLVDSTGFSSEVKEYIVKNNMLDINDKLFVAMPVELRQITWKDKQIPLVDGPTYTLVQWDVLQVRKAAKLGEDDEYQVITPKYIAESGTTPGTIITVQFLVDGTGLVSKDYGKCVWLDVTGNRNFANDRFYSPPSP